VFATALAVALAACHKDSPAAPTLPTKIAPTPGSNAQVGTVGQQLAAPVTVQVLDANGNPMSGVTITWTILAGGGSLDASTSTTDASGNALVHWTLGTVAGADSLQALVGGAVWVDVGATAQPGAVASLQKVSGDQQNVPDGSTSAPIVVEALDQYGNVVPNATITWMDENGGALSTTSTTTDSSGKATVTLATDQAPETYTIVAEDGSVQVTFVVTSN
jgi:adhesin/invasin